MFYHLLCLAESNRLVNIQELVLSSSHIAHISGVGLRGLYNLVRLDLSHNLLAAVPSPALGLTAQLRDLSLAYNPLGELEVHAQTSFYQENLAFCFQLCTVTHFVGFLLLPWFSCSLVFLPYS